MAQPSSLGIDTTRPNIARVYDYLLGGKDNFAADRELAGRLLSVDPRAGEWARDNRAFVCAAAARAAREGGIDQFLDLGAGLPTHPAVHEAVREVIPDARVAYVDIDGVAVTHGQALLAKGVGLVTYRADLTEPDTVLGAPELAGAIDLSRPVGIIIGGVAHFLAAAVVREVTGAYLAQVPAGSWLMISAGMVEDEAPGSTIQQLYTASNTFRHTREEFATFLAGTDIVPPGVVEARRWLAGIAGPPPTEGMYVQCGAGIKRLRSCRSACGGGSRESSIEIEGSRGRVLVSVEAGVTAEAWPTARWPGPNDVVATTTRTRRHGCHNDAVGIRVVAVLHCEKRLETN